MGSSVLNLNSSTCCRVCLQNQEVSNSLFDMVQYEDGKQMEIREILQIVCKSGTIESTATAIAIGLSQQQQPTRICEICSEKLFGAYDLLRMIERSEQLLSMALFQQDCIEEEQFDDDPAEQMCSTEQNVEADEDEEANIESENLEVLEEEEFESMNSEENQVELCDELQQNETYVEEFIVCDMPEQMKTASESELNIGSGSHKKRAATNTRRYEIGSRLNNTENANWHKCEYCKRSFAKSETYDKHMRIAHPQTPLVKIEPELTAKPDEQQSIPCPHCPRLFARPDNLRRHLRAVHSEEVDYLEGATENNRKQHKYKRGLCPFCGQSFSQASLAVHIRRHTGENPYKCNNKDCQKAFPRRQDLIIHQRQHTGERPHVCTVCGKSFMRPNKLTRHLRIHTGHRPYKCTECDKTFSQSNDLKIHLRRHSGEKPYRCGVCGEGFICGTKLKSHRKQKSHYADEDEQQSADPYAKCRVINRNTTQSIIASTESAAIGEIIHDFKEFY